MTDRLNEIKRRPLFEDVPWLINQVERLREAIEKAKPGTTGWAFEILRKATEEE